MKRYAELQGNLKKQRIKSLCDNKLVVTGSGSITAYDLLQTASGSALNAVKERFNNVVTYSSSVPTGSQSDRTEKDILMFVWDARDLDTGEYMAFDFVPCFITSPDTVQPTAAVRPHPSTSAPLIPTSMATAEAIRSSLTRARSVRRLPHGMLHKASTPSNGFGEAIASNPLFSPLLSFNPIHC